MKETGLNILIKKSYKMSFKPQVRSRHPSHHSLRENNVLNKKRVKSVIRLGSTTVFHDTIANGGLRVEINTVEAVKNSSDKLIMKQLFHKNNIPTAKWWTFNNEKFVDPNGNEININELPFPIISKSRYGSRGRGNIKHDTVEDLKQWLEEKNLSNYIFEKYTNYSREYRLHVTSNGCFYTCRKMIKTDTPTDKRWFRNDSNSVWILESNPNFDKPVNWETIVNSCVDALNAVGLDIGAIDLRVQSATDKKGNKREFPKYFIVETNSAPSFGDITKQKYIIELNNLLNDKVPNTI